MVSVKQIPNLPVVIALAGTELFEAVQAGVSVRVTLQQIAGYVQATPLAALTFTTPLVRTADNVTLTTVPITLGGTGVVGFGEVVSKTADYSVVAADSYREFDNNGAAGAVVFSLPASVVGLANGYAVMEAQDLTVDPPTGVTIYYGEGLSTLPGQALMANTVGSYIKIRCRTATEWLAESVIGGWNPV